MSDPIRYGGRSYSVDERGYYYNSATRTYLHRAVWRDENGEIPDGHHIHHIDGDKGNNDPANLECLAVREHAERHPEWGGGDFPTAAREAAKE